MEELGESAEDLEGKFSELDQGINATTDGALGKAVTTFGAAAASAGLLLNYLVGLSREMVNFSNLTGLPLSDLQQMEQIGRRLGTDARDINDAWLDISESINQTLVLQDTQRLEAYARLGIHQAELQELTSLTGLRLLERLSQLVNESGLNRQQQITVLRDAGLNEQRVLQLATEGEALIESTRDLRRASDASIEAFARLGRETDDLTSETIAGLQDAVAPLVPHFIELAEALRERVLPNLTTFAEELSGRIAEGGLQSFAFEAPFVPARAIGRQFFGAGQLVGEAIAPPSEENPLLSALLSQLADEFVAEESARTAAHLERQEARRAEEENTEAVEENTRALTGLIQTVPTPTDTVETLTGTRTTPRYAGLRAPPTGAPSAEDLQALSVATLTGIFEDIDRVGALNVLSSEAIAEAKEEEARTTQIVTQNLSQFANDLFQGRASVQSFIAALAGDLFTEHILAPLSGRISTLLSRHGGGSSSGPGFYLPEKEEPIFLGQNAQFVAAETFRRATSGGGMSFTYAPTINAVDAVGVAGVLEEHSLEIQAIISEQLGGNTAMAARTLRRGA